MVANGKRVLVKKEYISFVIEQKWEYAEVL